MRQSMNPRASYMPDSMDAGDNEALEKDVVRRNILLLKILFVL